MTSERTQTGAGSPSSSTPLLCGVYDNTATMRRERYVDGRLLSSLPVTDDMRDNRDFPWGCFDDVPNKALSESDR